MRVEVLPILKHTLGLIPKGIGVISIAINTICSLGITAAITDKLTDGQSTRAVLDLGEKAIGKDGMRKVGHGVMDSAQYLGEGLVSVGAEVNERYRDPNSAVIVPPITGMGLMAESAAIAQGAAIRERAGAIQSSQGPKGEFLVSSTGAERPASAPQAVVEQKHVLPASLSKKL